jgi:hypothetical protein
MDKGFVILAQNASVNYVRCAELLAESILRVMPDAKVSLISNNKTTSTVWDKVIKLPHGDLGGFYNDWQVYEASPYEYTIKLEADMYVPCSIDYWWEVLKSRDVVISTTIRNFKQDISHIKTYRRFIVDNELPDTYNAITYFKKSDVAKEFFDTVRFVFENWEDIKPEFKCNPEEPATTDFVYSIASHIVGVEKTTLPNFAQMSMIHMKQFINTMPTEDWTTTLVYEILPHTIRVNTIPQMYPFHYHIKEFSDRIAEAFYD